MGIFPSEEEKKMRKWAGSIMAALMLLVVLAGNAWSMTFTFKKPGGGAVIQENNHVVFLKLLNTPSARGVLPRKSLKSGDLVFINEASALKFVGSNTVKSSEITLISSRPGVSPTVAMVTLNGTLERDSGNWFLELKTGGEVEIDPRQLELQGRNVTLQESVRVSYGGTGDGTPPPVLQESSMDFKEGKLRVGFNVNPRMGGVVKGFMQDVNLFDIESVRWSSDKKGWGDGSVAIGKFPLDTEGNIVMPVITIEGLDPDDNGNVVIKKKDGTLVWCNIGFEGWKFSPNVTLDQKEGRIVYTGNK